jgi:hypothetical protein
MHLRNGRFVVAAHGVLRRTYAWEVIAGSSLARDNGVTSIIYGHRLSQVAIEPAKRNVQ